MSDTGKLLESAGFLRALARRLLDDDARADDVVQDTLVVGWRRGVAERGFLAAVARNFARMAHREDRRRRRRERVAARPEAVDAATAERIELQRQVVAAVEELPEPYRSTIVLRYLDGLKPAAIARRHDVPVKTVQTRLRRAIERLRGLLDRRHGRRRWSAALLPLAAARTAPALGALAMKKALVVLAAVAALAVGVVAVHRATRPPNRGEAAAARDASGAPAESARAPAKEKRTEGEVAREQERDEMTGVALRGVVRYAVDDAAPASIAVRPVGLYGRTAGEKAHELETDPERRFEADVTDLIGAPHVRELELVVDQPRHVPRTLRVSVDRDVGPPAIEPVAVELAAAAVVTGVVRTPDGAHAADARVALFAFDGDAPERRPRDHGRTDERGRYRLRSPRGGAHAAVALARGFAPGHARLRLEVAATREAEGIAVLDGPALSGRVTVNGSAPPRPVTVRAWRPEADGIRLRFASLFWTGEGFVATRAEAKADDDGRYRIGGLTPGPWNVRAAGLEGAHMEVHQEGPEHRDVEPPAGGLDLAVARLRVRIRDGRRAHVAVHGRGTMCWNTDAGGVLEMLVRPGAAYTVEAGRRGFGHARRKVAAPGPGKRLDVELDLVRKAEPAALRLRLVGEDLPRLAGIGLFAPDDGRARPAFHRTVRRRDGIFELSGIPAGRYHVVVRPGTVWPHPVSTWLEASTRVDLPEGGVAETTVAVARGGLLRVLPRDPERGRIVLRDAAGKIVRRRFFTALPRGGWTWSDGWYGPEPTLAGPALPPGEYEATLSAEGRRTVRTRVRIAAGETTDLEATLPPE